MEQPVAQPVRLHRTLGPIEVLLLTFSALSPVLSVFIAAPAVIHLAGSGAALGFIVGGVLSAVVTFLYAELGAAFPFAGGLYPSLVRILGPAISLPYILQMMLIGPFLLAFGALGLGDYVRTLLPGWPELPIAICGLAIPFGIAVLNVRASALITGVFLAIEATAIAVVTVLALTHPARPLWELLAHPIIADQDGIHSTPATTLGLAIISGLWTSSGASWAMYFGEELTEARRRIGPVMVIAGVLASILIAGPVVLLLLSAPDLPRVLAAEAPIAEYLSETGGPIASALVSVGVIAAIFNSLAAGAMAISRFIYSTGRDGIWPAAMNRLLSRLSPRFRSPLIATAFLYVAAVTAALFGEQTALLLISGGFTFEILLVSVAILQGRRRRLTGANFKVPLHPLLPLGGIALTVVFLAVNWLDANTGRPSMIILSAVFLGGLAFYWLRHGRGKAPWRMAEIGEDA